MAKMSKSSSSENIKKVVYLIGAGATQAEASHRSITPVNLMMRDSIELGQVGVSTRIIKRANLDRRLGITSETDIEKLISLLAATGIEKYREEAEKLRQAYYNVILESLYEADIINKPALTVGLFEMHNNKLFKKIEHLSGVISLNHDNFVQVASQKVHKFLNIGLVFDSEPFTMKDSKRGPIILQLHGSFNWISGRPIKVRKLDENIEYSGDMLWIPPTIMKEAKDYPYNKLMGLAYELLTTECDILRIIGCSLSQNDWNLISLLFNAQYMQLIKTRRCFKIELIMSNRACKRIGKEYSYFKNLIPITEIKEGIPKEDFEQEETFPINSEIRNPFKYWLKKKTQYHITKKQFDTKSIGATLKQILEV